MPHNPLAFTYVSATFCRTTVTAECAPVGGAGWPPSAAQGSADAALAAASSCTSGAVACVDMDLHPVLLGQGQWRQQAGCAHAGSHSTSRRCTAYNRAALTLARRQKAHDIQRHAAPLPAAHLSAATRAPARQWAPAIGYLPCRGFEVRKATCVPTRADKVYHKGTAWTIALVLHWC